MDAKLICLDDEREFPLSDAGLSIGSDTNCDAVLTGPDIVAQHAQVSPTVDGWELRARPGASITVDGRSLDHLRLEHGDEFAIGTATLRFESSVAVIERSPMAGKQFKDVDQALGHFKDDINKVRDEVGRIVVGQREVLDQVLAALFCGGHCLLVGAPGLAKTLLVRVLAGTLDLTANRVQFTPDLMPSDITGTDVLEEDKVSGQRSFRFRKGPLFTNVLLADEINRTPPKTQAALLEAMQERRVSTAGITYDLPRPFMVLATQNPIEQEGTYPLPEAQLDRFMFNIAVDYPSRDEERLILLETTADVDWTVRRVLSSKRIARYQHLLRLLPISDHVVDYVTALVRATRPDDPTAPDWIKRWVRWGAGPRAGQYLLLAAKAAAALDGRASVGCADVRKYAKSVLRHRIFPSFAAASEKVDANSIVDRLLAEVKEADYGG
ncbi:MAG: AAA family ATPase [Planctomycetota bacterium]|jgi:MoxR-like ATPase|nr:AAA family ATPase [Planctomycetota bacterium]